MKVYHILVRLIEEEKDEIFIYIYILSINDTVCFHIVYKEITFLYTVISQENYSDVIYVCFLFILFQE